VTRKRSFERVAKRSQYGWQIASATLVLISQALLLATHKDVAIGVASLILAIAAALLLAYSVWKFARWPRKNDRR
jgi:uncharacterized membrane protein